MYVPTYLLRYLGTCNDHPGLGSLGGARRCAKVHTGKTDPCRAYLIIFAKLPSPYR